MLACEELSNQLTHCSGLDERGLDVRTGTKVLVPVSLNLDDLLLAWLHSTVYVL